MKSVERRTCLIFDLFFGIVLMPLLIIIGPAKYWWAVSSVYTILAILYLYGCYFATKRLEIPQLILSKSYYKISVVIIAFAVLTYLLTLYPLPEIDFVIPSMSEYQTRVRNYEMAVSIWLMFFVVECYSLTVAFIKELYKRLIMQNIIENQKNQAELALFKAQINPHFLFNTLNSLYCLVIGTSQKAEDAFIKFTELLKYVYITADNEWVAIKDEVNYINNYIDLQLIRLDRHTKVIWDCSVDDETVDIPPMIFLAFIENAFKYGTSTRQSCEILIKLHINNGMLLFETQNQIMKHADEFRKDMPVGIKNCKSRLACLYPNKHILNIEENGSVFRVSLKIDIHKV